MKRLPGHVLPHGCVDLEAFTNNPKSTTAVSIQCFIDNKTVTGVCFPITAATLKSNHTYANPGSER